MKQSGTRISAVMGEIRSKIASRTYMPGTRLPSVRAQNFLRFNVAQSTGRRIFDVLARALAA